MAVFRIEKTRDYTVMSNHHLRDMSLSLKAKGLLSLMLSLPENWDYTMKGLARICKDGIDSISGGIRELEEHGYLIRERVRGANGQLGSIEYTILEQPKANALLDEAGWVMNESTGIREKDGQQLSLNYTYWTDLSLAQDMALAIKTQLAEVGIDVTTTGQDQMTWWTEGVAGNYDITTWNTEGSYTEPHKFLQESLGADPHAISLQALEDFQSYSDAVNAFSTSADPEVVQSAIATALNVSNDNVIDLPISYSKDLVVYNSSKIAGYTFSSVPQFFEIDNVQPAE